MKRASALVIATLTMLLVGCSPQVPFTESFETAIPAALTASDLGITSASAETSTSGFAVSLSVHIVLDRDSMTSEEFGELLAIVVDANNLDSPTDLRVSARNETETGADDAYLALSTVAEELGFSINPNDRDPMDFDADWDSVVDFVRTR